MACLENKLKCIKWTSNYLKIFNKKLNLIRCAMYCTLIFNYRCAKAGTCNWTPQTARTANTKCGIMATAISLKGNSGHSRFQEIFLTYSWIKSENLVFLVFVRTIAASEQRYYIFCNFCCFCLSAQLELSFQRWSTKI